MADPEPTDNGRHAASLSMVEAEATDTEPQMVTKDVRLMRGGFLRRLCNNNCLFVKNMTPQAVTVYIKSNYRQGMNIRKLKTQVSLEGVSAVIERVFEIHREPSDMAVKVGPTPPEESSYLIELPTDADHYVTIVRLSTFGEKLDEWDCLGLKVSPGRKLQLTGDGVPLTSLLL